MADKMFSREERMERMSARIQGTDPHSQATSNRSSGHNILLGVSLQAALRLSQGKPLSDLEQNALAGLRVICDDDDEEIAYYGSCFQRVKDQWRSSNGEQTFPACILDLDGEESYTFKQLGQDIKHLGPEITSESANQVIDLGKLSSGWSIDSDEYLEALEAAEGIGATLLTGPPTSASSKIKKQDKGINEAVKIRVKGFTCIEKFDQDPESIYWGHAAGSDVELKRSGVTGATQIVDDNMWYSVDEILFEGISNNHLVAHIGCWVKYRGASDWIDKVKQITQNLSSHCVDAAIQDHDHDDEDDQGRTDDTAAVLVVAALAKNYISDLIKSVGPNFDDSLATRSIGFTQKGLDYFLEQTGYTIRLDYFAKIGKGKYRLEIDRILDSRPGLMGVTSSSDGERWSSLLTVPNSTSFHGMTLVECLGTLYGVFAKDTQIHISRMGVNGNWETPIPIPDTGTESHIGAGVVNGIFEIIYRGIDSHLYRVLSDFNQSDPMRRFEKIPLQTMGSLITSFGTDMKLLRDGLVLCTTLLLKATDEEESKLWTCFVLKVEKGWMWPFPFQNWQDERHAPPAIVFWDRMAHFVTCGPESGLKVYYLSLGTSGPPLVIQIKDFEFTPAISATVLGRELWIAYQRSDGRVWLTVFPSRDERETYRNIETKFFAQKNTQPVIYTFNDKLYLTLADPEVV